MKYTNQQIALFDWARNGSGHAILQARAGCGKTTTLIGLCEAILSKTPKANISLMAYNKAIQTEIAAKLMRRAAEIEHIIRNESSYDETLDDVAKGLAKGLAKVRAKTLHAAGLSEWRYQNKSVTVDDKKMELIVRSINHPFAAQYEQNILRLVSYAKSYAIGYLTPVEDRRAWYDLIDHFDLNGFDDSTDVDGVVDIAQQALLKSFASDRTIIDFDDMILAPLVHKYRTFPLDWVLIDEAQDLSPARRSLAIALAGKKGRMVFVGDDRQAIYGFSGADSDSINEIQRLTHATMMPLNVTWRCPKAVVRVAQEIVSDIEAADEAPEGKVWSVDALFGESGGRVIGERQTTYPAELLPTDAVLCRTNAPLVETAFALIRRGVACRVEGRDIGKGLIALILRWKVKSIDAYLDRLDTWEQKERAKALAKGSDTKAQAAIDKADTLRVIATKAVADGRTDVQAMVDIIQSLFADDVRGVLTLCSVHRSKGREWPRVFIICPDLLPAPWARQDWEKLQELNLRYVAVTRAQNELVFVGG